MSTITSQLAQSSNHCQLANNVLLWGTAPLVGREFSKYSTRFRNAVATYLHYSGSCTDLYKPNSSSAMEHHGLPPSLSWTCFPLVFCTNATFYSQSFSFHCLAAVYKQLMTEIVDIWNSLPEDEVEFYSITMFQINSDRYLNRQSIEGHEPNACKLDLC